MNTLVYRLKMSSNFRMLMVPVFTITVVVLVLIIFAPQGISRIDKKIKEFKSAQSQEVVLNAKLDSLKSISLDTLDPKDITVIALPSKNPAIWVVSHVRRLSSESDIEILKMSVERSKDTEKFKNSSIEFEIDAKDYPTLLTYINNLTKILPLTSLDTVSVKRSSGQEGDVFKGDIAASFYWSDFPKTLPPISEPINELTGEDLNIISLISGFVQPSFIELSPNEPQERLQPYN